MMQISQRLCPVRSSLASNRKLPPWRGNVHEQFPPLILALGQNAHLSLRSRLLSYIFPWVFIYHPSFACRFFLLSHRHGAPPPPSSFFCCVSRKCAQHITPEAYPTPPPHNHRHPTPNLQEFHLGAGSPRLRNGRCSYHISALIGSELQSQFGRVVWRRVPLRRC